MMFSIKPLEWSGRSSNGKIHKAYVVPMEYWAWESAGFGYWSWGALAGREVHGGLDAAKAAAQADYEQRIRTALTNQPIATNASAEARLRDLLTDVMSQFRHRGCECTFPSETCCAYAKAEVFLIEHPHASDCARDDCGAYRCRDLGCFGVCKPSDRTADVTEERHPIETLWREVGLPEYFLGNAGTNHKLYALYDAIRSFDAFTVGRR